MLEQFIVDLERQGKSKNTISAYKTDIQQFQTWLCDTLGHETNNITQTDIREFRQYLNIIKKLNVTSINRKLKSVVKYQNSLNDIGESNVRVKVNGVLQKNNIEQEHDIKIVEKNDLFRLKRTIEASENKRDIAIYYLLFGTGIRVSELINLEREDIKLTERNGKNSYSFILIRSGKGNKSRKINLNADVVNAVKDYLQDRLRLTSQSNKLLVGQRGALTRIAVNKLLEKYSRQAQLNFIVTPHMARHTAFTMMIKAGVDVKTVQQLAGHSSSDVTYKFYVASTVEDKQKAVDNLQI
jgi:integrase/recombinase XerC/integrase/recombinase XerD